MSEHLEKVIAEYTLPQIIEQFELVDYHDDIGHKLVNNVAFTALKRLAAASDWVDVHDRLPDSDGTYEVTTYGMQNGVKTEPYVTSDDYSFGKFDDPYVTAWRERSQPYQPQTAEQGDEDKAQNEFMMGLCT